jgi:EAL domain-containing protein (putative c-di-GMP-specific phosphodiesterase class I)
MLDEALTDHRVIAYYHPVIDLDSGLVAGVEALARIAALDGTILQPAAFIAVAEDTGLVVPLGAQMLATACRESREWSDPSSSRQTRSVAVNIAPQQLRDRDVVGLTRRLLDRYGLQGDMLEMEITEAAFVDPEAEATLEALAKLGVRLTLDDFGTGYSALGHLRRYPVRTVKIDRSFIEDIAVNPSSAALAETIIVMAHKLGKQVVAEGVETIEQLDFLREQGCDIAQGYYLARPTDEAGIESLLATRSTTAGVVGVVSV